MYVWITEDSSPIGSPPERVYYWSKSNNYDYVGKVHKGFNVAQVNGSKKVNSDSLNGLHNNTMTSTLPSNPSNSNVNGAAYTILHM